MPLGYHFANSPSGSFSASIPPRPDRVTLDANKQLGFDCPAAAFFCYNIFMAIFIGFVVGFLVALSLCRSTKDVGKDLGVTTKPKDDPAAKRRQKVLDYMKDNGEITNDKYEELTSISDAQATRDLEKLEEEGLIEQIGETGSGVKYRLKQ